MDVLRQLVLPKLDGVRPAGAGYEARCPAHEDRRASLSVGPGKDQPVVITCHAGCDRDLILDALGLTWAEVCIPRQDHDREDRQAGEWTPRGPAVAVYRYVDEQGRHLFDVCRTADKQFPQRRPDPGRTTGWTWKLGDVRRVLYRLPRIIDAAASGHTIHVVEGEKDVHTLEAHGAVATCNPSGAGKWRPEYSEVLRDADVVVIADRDPAGQAHARQVAAALDGIAATVRIVEPAAGKDATDHLDAGGSLVEFIETWNSTQPTTPDLAPDLWEFLGEVDPPHDWIVPELLERGDRLIWTGFEGLGKSMWTRQLAVMTAAGIHVHEWEHRITPSRVLMIDCENSERVARRKFRPLGRASVDYGRRVADGALRLIHRPEGIDLGQDDDAAWLLERVTAHRPDLLIIGPFYRLHAGNLNEEPAARRVVSVLDAARTKVDCAVVIEAHAGHGEQGKNRSVRPAGSSLLLRWPEFGYGIAPAKDPAAGEPCRDVIVKQWRGARDERHWPTHLTWGDSKSWPWQVYVTEEERTATWQAKP